MEIGFIGVGSVGGTLAGASVRAGHRVLLGVRDPKDAKVAALHAALGEHASVGTVAQAAAFGEVVVLATPWIGTRDALQKAGDLRGKVLIDCTNPLKGDLSGLELGHTTSGGEQVAKWAPGARVVKMFNTTGANNLADPHYGGRGITMLYCGDDASAKNIAAQLATEIGFEPIDAGPLSEARLLEPLALLWLHLAMFRDQGREIALTLLRR
ncbi:MAG: NADPH-dependent F420 reductase [Planctomycetota bacterium]